MLTNLIPTLRRDDECVCITPTRAGINVRVGQPGGILSYHATYTMANSTTAHTTPHTTINITCGGTFK